MIHVKGATNYSMGYLAFHNQHTRDVKTGILKQFIIIVALYDRNTLNIITLDLQLYLIESIH